MGLWGPMPRLWPPLSAATCGEAARHIPVTLDPAGPSTSSCPPKPELGLPCICCTAPWPWELHSSEEKPIVSFWGRREERPPLTVSSWRWTEGGTGRQEAEELQTGRRWTPAPWNATMGTSTYLAWESRQVLPRPRWRAWLLRGLLPRPGTETLHSLLPWIFPPNSPLPTGARCALGPRQGQAAPAVPQAATTTPPQPLPSHSSCSTLSVSLSDRLPDYGQPPPR